MESAEQKKERTPIEHLETGTPKPNTNPLATPGVKKKRLPRVEFTGEVSLMAYVPVGAMGLSK